MRKRRIVRRWSILGLVSVAALAFTVAVMAWQQNTASAACGANPCITVDADANTAGIQTNVIVNTGANFDISFEGSAIPASTVQGYQWEIQFTGAVVNFVSATENIGVTGASLCSPPADNTGAGAPAGEEWLGGGSGCLRPSGTFAAGAVRLTTITLQCDAQAPAGSTSDLHLVTGGDGASGQDPTFGTIYLAPGGAFVTTDLADATVQCGQGAALTPTNTAIPTDTPIPAATNTPLPTSTPGAATATLAPAFTRTPTPPATAVPGSPAPGGTSPTATGGGSTGAGGATPTPGGGNQGSITPPNTGTGGTESPPSRLPFALAAALGAAGLVVGAGGWQFRRRGRRRSS